MLLNQKTFHIRLNSPGGSVFDGIAIYNMLKPLKSKLSLENYGLAASISSIIPLAVDVENRSQGEGAFWMIHKPWVFAMGHSGELRKQADILDKIEGEMIPIYENNTKIGDKEAIASALENETWYTSDEAIEKGFASSTIGAQAKAPEWEMEYFKNVPNAAKGSRPTNICISQLSGIRCTS